MKPDNKFLEWWDAATPEERHQLAKFCRTSYETLRQEAHGYRNGGALAISLGRAAYVATGTRKLAREGLPVLARGDLCPLWKEIDALDAKTA